MKKKKIDDTVLPIDDKFYVQSIQRALKIIDEIGKNNSRGLGLSELAGKLTLPVSTVYRIIQNLVSWDYVRERENGNYVLGFALLYMGNIICETLNIPSYARKYMDKLSNETMETIYLSALDEKTARFIYIDKREGQHNIKLASTVGTRNYIHSTANGKCLVSTLCDDAITALLMQAGMPQLMNATIITISDYLKAVNDVRKNGYALDNQENEAGVVCIAAPIYDYSEKVVASISISGTIATITETQKPHYIDLVKDAALHISQELGYLYKKT
ncbi:IclR family transcriptional regulator [Megasphaera paucivorans]|uniref:Transcriptional regulator, IclR family n=1 Tax=Megasphaera paucivorans TaxID=349095 RepID=A0A1H0APP5_9FIRM|nr:IclR family transcriptional regulator [Megasphaera paucivorans]SDN34916.1 transcriptional regulator, IclR family [Megasphaera paucivorans]